MTTQINLDFNQMNSLLRRYDKNVSIVNGEAYAEIKKQLARVCPYQKALFIFEKSNNRKYENFISSLENINVTALTVGLENKPISVENALPCFAMPDDVRAVVCLDYCLIDYAIYYSHVKKLKLIVVLNSLNLISTLKSRLIIKNGESVDETAVNIDSTLIFDRQLLNESQSSIRDAYECVTSLSLSLLEYRLLRALGVKKTYREAYEIIKNSILSVYDLTAHDKNIRDEIVAYSALNVSVANYISGDEILSSSTVLACERANHINNVLDISIKVLGLSAYAFTEEVVAYKIPDYEVRANFLLEKFGINPKNSISGFLSSAQLIFKNRKEIEKFFKVNKEEIEGLILSLKKAKKISNNLLEEKSTKEDELNNGTIKFLGDFSGIINFCTLLREKGLLELI